jgi:hypothetical protein
VTVELPESVNASLGIQQLPPLPGVPEPLAGRMTVAVRYTAVGDVAEESVCFSRCATSHRHS